MIRWMKVTVVLATFAVMACQQNPYSGKSGVVGPTKPKPTAPADPKPDPKGTYALSAPDNMTFLEGQTGEFAVSGTVPEPGKAIITFSGMPSGMTFDTNTSKISWMPSFQDANDPNNPQQTTRLYNIRIDLTSDVDGNVSLSKDIAVLVQDIPQPINVTSTLTAMVTEGSTLTHDIQFQDNEFPAGPFDATVSGLPNGWELEWPSRNVPGFRLKWTPGYEVATKSATKNIKGHVVLYNPRGKRIEFDIKWDIQDKAAAPTISGPTTVEQTRDIEFMMIATDINGEDLPQFSVANRPNTGNLDVMTKAVPVGANDLPQSLGVIRWKDIPRGELGKEITMDVRACVRSNVCTTNTVNVKPVATSGGSNQ